MSIIDLSQIPAPKIIDELDFEQILQQRKAAFLELYPGAADVIENEAEPLCYLLQENAYREVIWRQRVNEAALATMLAYAQNSDLDQQAANLNTQRLVISPATKETPAVLEKDERLRMRAQRAFSTLTVAGPRSQYETIARASSGKVADVSALSFSPAVVTVTVLSYDGDGTADQELLDIVHNSLSPDDIRPIGDRLIIQSATVQHYSIEAVLHVPHGPEKAPIESAALQNLENWINSPELGRSIRTSQIINLLHVPGVHYVELISPASDTVLDRTQAAYCDSVAVTAEALID